jgi:DNA-binding PadR family transcriptional regulator
LSRLELDGCISSVWGLSENNRKAKYYTITARGKKILAGEQESWKRLSGAVQQVLAR